MPLDFIRCERGGGKMLTVRGEKYGCGQNQYRHA